jgi:hypothetical protein
LAAEHALAWRDGPARRPEVGVVEDDGGRLAIQHAEATASSTGATGSQRAGRGSDPR